MYNNRYVTELSISEVTEYYDILRENRKLTLEEIEDFRICKERLIAYAYNNIDKADVLDKIRAEIIQMPTISSNANDIYKADVLAIIDKYRETGE